MELCDLMTLRDGLAHACGRPAIARIARIDGSGALLTCGSHRDDAIIYVASRGKPDAPLQYTPVGTHANAIRRELIRIKDKEN